ncbi:hypothetical protein TeGR_g6361, partial [Tetraparma gracilis]
YARTLLSSLPPPGPLSSHLAGGELVCPLPPNPGSGGRCQQLALELSILLHRGACGGRDVAVVCLGTDGTDGPNDAAGAVATNDTVRRVFDAAEDKRGFGDALAYAEDFRDRFDAYNFFRGPELGRIDIGPTGTNVADVVVAFCAREGELKF